MSYVELDRDPEKLHLMATAFTLQSGLSQAKEIWKARSDNKPK